MTEQEMLSKDAFIDFILSGAENSATKAATSVGGTALPEGFEGFDEAEARPSAAQAGASFARRLLEASGFGYAALVQRDNVIRSTDAVARYLPDRVSFWPKTTTRSYQTLLFEADLNHKELLSIPAFRSRKMNHLDIVEDALARLVSEALEGFQRGGEGVTADVRKGRKEETLCVASIIDVREGQPVRLICFGTQNKTTGGLETFQISEQTRFWDTQLARDHLGLLYERQFKKLESKDWQEAFTTTEERKEAQKLLDVCTRKAPKENDIQEGILNLLDIIAKGFGLRRKPNTERRLQAFSLPSDHDIGIDPEERESRFGGRNPFGGVTLRDERNRLLGYIVYPLKAKLEADRLRKHLEVNNRFHNVLVVYPDEDQAILELWQGREKLNGKLRKGQGYKDAADVVNLLSRFFVVSKARVCNPSELAQELAYRARYLRRLALNQLKEEADTDHLRSLFRAFQEALINDLPEDDFADAYAQTLTYGLLSARWVSRDEYIASGERFTRASALKHMPATSPFLKRFFKKVLEATFEFKLTWLLDDIADLLDRVDIGYVFGAGDQNEGDSSDPVIHFYEPFLDAYDPGVKQSRGVFYTPDAVVSFMVRTVDSILRNQLGLPLGLADATTWREYAAQHNLILSNRNQADAPVVSVLDPAAGTGTFLKHAVLKMYETLTAHWRAGGMDKTQIRAAWDNYVTTQLVQRIHGLEVMAAPYAICHLKLALTLRQTGFTGPLPPLNVRLSNSLREADSTRQNGLFDAMVTEEAVAANALKNGSQPAFIVIGNPPYSGHSANLFEDSKRLIERYRSINGERIKEKGALQFERNLQDDYIKFIGLCQSVLRSRSRGVWCFVTNHGFVDGPTLSGLRFALLEDLARLHVLNVHGNVNRGEVAPDGSKDDNVFPIKDAGIAISCGMRTEKSDGSACECFYADLWGLKQAKIAYLEKNSVETVSWKSTNPRAPSYLLNEVASQAGDEYAGYWPLDRITREYSNGIVTARDGLVIDFNKDSLMKRISDFATRSGSTESVCAALCVSLKKGWDAEGARSSVKASLKAEKDWVFKCLYRPFEVVYLYYHPAVIQTMSSTSWHMAIGDNAAILVPRTVKGGQFHHVMVTALMSEAICLSTKTSVNGNCFPLWLYDGAKERVLRSHGLRSTGLALKATESRAANFNGEFLKTLEAHFGAKQRIDPKEIFFYIAAVLHSPSYQARYARQIGSEFPRVPLPRAMQLVKDLAVIGEQMMNCYDLRISKSDEAVVRLMGKGTDEVKRAVFDEAQGCVWINETQVLTPIKKAEWEFTVGDYGAIERWLVGGRAVTRKGRKLSKADVRQVCRIVAAVKELQALENKIDDIIGRQGGWPQAFVTKAGGDGK